MTLRFEHRIPWKSEPRPSQAGAHFIKSEGASGALPGRPGSGWLWLPRAAAADTFACLEAFLASPKLGGLVVTEVNPDHDPGGQLARLVDGLVAAMARQGPRSPGLSTIRS